MSRPDIGIDVDCARSGLFVYCTITVGHNGDLMRVSAWTRKGALRAAEQGLRVCLLGYETLTAKRDYEDRVAS